MLTMSIGEYTKMFETAGELYRDVCSAVLSQGRERTTRGFKTKELMAAKLILLDPYQSIVATKARSMKLGFAAAEMAWIISGSNDARRISFYNREMLKFSDDGKTLFGAYGPQFKAGLQHVLHMLKEDRETRQAVITFWRPMHDANFKTKDLPCTVSLHFLPENGKLHLIVYMRSNDVWLGLPYDMSTFTCLQQLIASTAGFKMGIYVHQVGSLHLYESDYTKAAAVASQPPKTLEWPITLSNDIFSVSDKLDEYDLVTRHALPHQVDKAYADPAIIGDDPFIDFAARLMLKKRIDHENKLRQADQVDAIESGSSDPAPQDGSAVID